jgi:hypothetical protein
METISSVPDQGQNGLHLAIFLIETDQFMFSLPCVEITTMPDLVAAGCYGPNRRGTVLGNQEPVIQEAKSNYRV